MTNLNNQKYNEELESKLLHEKTAFLLDKLEETQESILDSVKTLERHLYKNSEEERDTAIIKLLNLMEELDSEIKARNFNLRFKYKSPEEMNLDFGSIYKHEKGDELNVSGEGALDLEDNLLVQEGKETVQVKLDIEKHEQFMIHYSTPEYLLSYVITDQTGVTRGGRKIINTDKYDHGILTDFAIKLIEQYKEAILKGDVISYTGEFAL